MSAGLFALLDDIAALARVAAASLDDIAAGAAKAGSKTVAVVVDDAAVTPQYVSGITPKRELPIIWSITKGSLRNKFIFILPAILVLSQFLPWTLPFLLILGGSYLAYEGAHKIIEKLTPGTKHKAPALIQGPEAEKEIIKSATTTDFILSAEIMVIALNEVTDMPFVQRLAVLAIVALAITALVYGVVALIVKADDAGLALTHKESRGMQKIGALILRTMPKVMTALTVIGTIAMLWVGGHIVLAQLAEVGFATPYEALHRITEPVLAAAGGAVAWLVDTVISALIGLIWGAIIAGVMHLIPRKKTTDHQPIHLDQVQVVLETDVEDKR
ncbi:MAG: DUF808 domain-containing protein [Actinomycetaceae bacterium]|nr:DUF808 domain-containing protein [Actinomycetaceae bacterium]